MNREVLKAGEDFESGWVEEITFEQMYQHHYGVSIVMNGTRYGYLVHEDNVEALKSEARATLTDNTASAGRAYNELVKKTDVQEAVGLGPVAEFDDE